MSSLSITDYEFVSQQQVTPTQRSVTYHATLLNTGGPLASVTATVDSLNPFSVRIVPGQDTLTFFSILANSKTTSIGTFTVLINNMQPFDFSSLHWTFKNSTAGPVANAGPDANCSGGQQCYLERLRFKQSERHRHFKLQLGFHFTPTRIHHKAAIG